ncbi:uncharacterized protein TM35_000103130, partial [Trypanosoma theileri]
MKSSDLGEKSKLGEQQQQTGSLSRTTHVAPSEERTVTQTTTGSSAEDEAVRSSPSPDDAGLQITNQGLTETQTTLSPTTGTQSSEKDDSNTQEQSETTTE